MEEHCQKKNTKLKKYPNIKSIDLSRSKLEYQQFGNLHSERQPIERNIEEKN